MNERHQQGMASWEVILAIVVVILIGFAGYEVYRVHKKMDVSPVQNEKSNTAPISAPLAPSVTSST